MQTVPGEGIFDLLRINYEGQWFKWEQEFDRSLRFNELVNR